MPAPPAYLDECIDRPVADDLRRRGFDILTALEAGRGQDADEEQLTYATDVGRVIVTYNRMDFRRLHRAHVQANRPHEGIIILPQAPPVHRRQLRAAMLLEWFGIAAIDHFHLMAWNDLQQELLRGTRIDGFDEDEVYEALGR